jgi:sec-independent protein translocase protein TatC
MQEKATVLAHLQELRIRAIISLAALFIAAICGFPFAAIFLKILRLPTGQAVDKLAVFSPQEAFLIHMRIAFLLGFTVSLPVILYQAWRFISPAVDTRFKRHAASFVFSSSFAFLIGGTFAYFILLPAALKFLLSFAQGDLEPVISAQNYISFVIAIIFGTGLIFQMPVLSFILTKTGIINPGTLRRKRRFAIPAIFIAAAVITPTTDAFNLLIFALPMLLLYEVSILISRIAQ